MEVGIFTDHNHQILPNKTGLAAVFDTLIHNYYGPKGGRESLAYGVATLAYDLATLGNIRESDHWSRVKGLFNEIMMAEFFGQLVNPLQCNPRNISIRIASREVDNLGIDFEVCRRGSLIGGLDVKSHSGRSLKFKYPHAHLTPDEYANLPIIILRTGSYDIGVHNLISDIYASIDSGIPADPAAIMANMVATGNIAPVCAHIVDQIIGYTLEYKQELGPAFYHGLIDIAEQLMVYYDQTSG